MLVEDTRTMSNRERIRGCHQAMLAAGIQPDDQLVKLGGFTVDEGKAAAGKLLDMKAPPSAIFACNDLLAIGAIQAARERGMLLPQQLSVAGFDNTILVTIIAPSLTTKGSRSRRSGGRRWICSSRRSRARNRRSSGPC
nr:substrate-binding domain-containing protein [Paenibacillus tianmuensis]